MDKVPTRVVYTEHIIRWEMEAPVDAKHWAFLWSQFLDDFRKAKGRDPEFDNDWWVEPRDEDVAICYRVDGRRAD